MIICHKGCPDKEVVVNDVFSTENLLLNAYRPYIFGYHDVLMKRKIENVIACSSDVSVGLSRGGGVTNGIRNLHFGDFFRLSGLKNAVELLSIANSLLVVTTYYTTLILRWYITDTQVVISLINHQYLNIRI